MFLFLLSHWRIFLAAAFIGLAFAAGWKAATTVYNQKYIDALEQQRIEFEALDKERLAQATELEEKLRKARQQKEIRYVERQKIIERPIYSECRVDDDGLRFIAERTSEVNATLKHAYGLPSD